MVSIWTTLDRMTGVMIHIHFSHLGKEKKVKEKKDTIHKMGESRFWFLRYHSLEKQRLWIEGMRGK